MPGKDSKENAEVWDKIMASVDKDGDGEISGKEFYDEIMQMLE